MICGSASELVAVIAPSGDEPSAFVCANVTVFDASFTSPYLVMEAAGKKIGITSVLGQRNQNQVNNDEITMRPAEEGLAEVWPKLQQAQCDLYVLIAHASMEESRALAQKFPQFPLVVTTGGAGEPTLEPEKIEGTRSQMIQVGTKGMYAGVVALGDDPAQPLRYQRVPLDARFPDSDDMLQLLAAYQDQLKEAGFEGLGIRPQPLPERRRSSSVRSRVPNATRTRGTSGRTGSTETHPSTRMPMPRCSSRPNAQGAPQLRSGVLELPRRRLESAEVLSLPVRIHESREHAGTDQRRVRELPRAGSRTCGCRERRRGTGGRGHREAA